MQKSILFLFLTFFVSFANAEDGKVPCVNADGSLGLDTVKKFDCDLVKSIVTDEKIKNQYEDKIYGKLADQVANKITQSLEDVALLDQFYTHHKKELQIDNSGIKDKCRIEVFANPKCAENNDRVKKRLNLIMSKFPKSGSETDTLFDRISSQAINLRAPILKNKLQCPISDKSGFFLLKSQLSEQAAFKIWQSFKGEFEGSEEKHREATLERFFSDFPQLKLLKNADLSAKDQNIQQKFQSYLKAFNPATSPPITHYMNKFFLEDENQPQLSKGLAAQCESVSQSIQKFVCNDLSHLGSSSDFTEMLFADDEEKEQELNLQISKGFSCEYKKIEDNEEVEDIEKLSENGSIESWYTQLSSNTRPNVDQGQMDVVIDPFCATFSCKSPESKLLDSCQQGGPVSYQDLEKRYCPNINDNIKENDADCSEENQKYIAYLKNLKDTQNIIESNQSLASDTETFGPSDAKPRKRYSSFFENFVGVKGALKAEGRPITSTTIAQKEAEFTERKLSLSSKSSSAKNSISANKEVPQKDTAQQKPQQPSPSPTNNAINYEKFMKLGDAQKEANEKLKKDIIDRANSKYIDGAAGATNTSVSAAKSRAISAAEAERNSEIEKLRSELASVTDSIKGTPEQKLATIAANNSTYEPTKSNYDPQKAMNQAEKERLARYRENLDARDEELRKREFEARTSSFGRNTDGEKRQEAARAAAESANSSSSAGSGAVKLSKGSSISTGGGVSGSADSSGKGEKGAVSEIAETDFVSSEKLATLGALSDLGMEGKESFIMRVRHNGKIYEIPVKTFTYKEKKILMPLLSEKNRELAQIVFESPLFSDYQKYQLDKQK